MWNLGIGEAVSVRLSSSWIVLELTVHEQADKNTDVQWGRFRVDWNPQA